MRKCAVGGVLISLVTTTACSASSTISSTGAGGGSSAAQVSITPAAGSQDVRPERGVTVKAAGGTLDQVTVTTGSGKTVPGAFNANRTEWRSKWTLSPSKAYDVTATAKDANGEVTQATSQFTTLTPSQTISASLDWILQGNQGKTFGVGMPIILNFDRAVFNKEQVEQALEVTAEKRVEGAWHWVSDQQVVYRPKSYWPAHQTVKLNARLAGVRAAKGVYGTRNFTRVFEIGAARISKINLKTHQMTVTIDGKRVRSVPISAGNATTREFTTTSGVHLTMEKANPVRMVAPGRQPGDPGYYDLVVPHAVRISNSGEYLHQTVGEEHCLGEANCSHGCVRQGAGDAVWFYNHVQPGDIVDITGSNRELEWNNGWGFWQRSWNNWKKGSALA